MELKPKTLEEHRQYLYDICKLKLFFMHDWLAKHPEEDFVFVLRQRVDIYRKTDANPGPLTPQGEKWDSPAWQEIEQGLLAVYEKTKDDEALFERLGFEVIKPSLDARCERDYTDPSPLAHYRCGSLRFDIHAQNEHVERVGFHIANAVSPHSIFENPRYLPSCFLILMDQVEAMYGATEIRTHTWLNSNPKWLALFPKEWHDNLGAPVLEPQWHYGFWGQMINSRGLFNEKLGAYVRANRRLFYYPREAFAPISVLRPHFEALLKK